MPAYGGLVPTLAMGLPMPAPVVMQRQPIAMLGQVPMLRGLQAQHQGLVNAFRTSSPTAAGFLEVSRGLVAASPTVHSIVAVSSVQPSEGKSQLAAGLAATLAMQGKRTLLIDCHLSAAGLTNWLPQGPEVPGLRQMLQSGESVLDLNSLRYARTDLFVLHTGGVAPDPQFFATSSFQELLRVFAREVDTVILDCPCLQETAEIRSLLPAASQVLLAWDSKVTDRQMLQWGADLVGSINARSTLAAVECC
jgi:Mrp family chromosome partitioning ATPase